MRTLRLALYLVVGLMLGGVAVLAKAETIPMSTQPSYGDMNGITSNKVTVAEVCTVLSQYYGSVLPVATSDYTSGWVCSSADGRTKIGVTKGTRMGCPSGYTPNSADQTCFKPDACPSDQTWDSIASRCVPKCSGNQTLTLGVDTACKCDASALNSAAGERPWFSGKGSTPSTLCDGGCSRGTGFGLGGGGSYTVQGGAFTGEKCTAESTKGNEIKSKQPPCAASEGVMTSTSGTVACVPEGTPDARKPVVDKKKQVETYPDNSTKTTEQITTTDPATGAKNQSATVTSTGGLSGTAGTSTSNTSSSSSSGGSGDGGQGECALEPNGPLCRAGAVSGEKGKFNKRDEEIETAKAELRAKFDSIKLEAASLFSSFGVGGGSLPCPDPAIVLGRPISFCTTAYESQVSVIGLVVYLAAAIGAAFIIFRR